jgi:hypothetical protein
LAAAAYIRELYDRYGAPGFLAAYNAGPGQYESHLATGRPLPDETRDYIAMLAPIIGGKQANGKIVAPADSPTLARRYSLCALRVALPTIAMRLVYGQTVHQMFVPLSVYPLSCRSRATCLCTMPARPDRNDPDRASSQFIVGRCVF